MKKNFKNEIDQHCLVMSWINEIISVNYGTSELERLQIWQNQQFPGWFGPDTFLPANLRPDIIVEFNSCRLAIIEFKTSSAKLNEIITKLEGFSDRGYELLIAIAGDKMCCLDNSQKKSRKWIQYKLNKEDLSALLLSQIAFKTFINYDTERKGLFGLIDTGKHTFQVIGGINFSGKTRVLEEIEFYFWKKYRELAICFNISLLSRGFDISSTIWTSVRYYLSEHMKCGSILRNDKQGDMYCKLINILANFKYIVFLIDDANIENIPDISEFHNRLLESSKIIYTYCTITTRLDSECDLFIRPLNKKHFKSLDVDYNMYQKLSNYELYAYDFQKISEFRSHPDYEIRIGDYLDGSNRKKHELTQSDISFLQYIHVFSTNGFVPERYVNYLKSIAPDVNIARLLDQKRIYTNNRGYIVCCASVPQPVAVNICEILGAYFSGYKNHSNYIFSETELFDEVDCAINYLLNNKLYTCTAIILGKYYYVYYKNIYIDSLNKHVSKLVSAKLFCDKAAYDRIKILHKYIGYSSSVVQKNSLNRLISEYANKYSSDILSHYLKLYKKRITCNYVESPDIIISGIFDHLDYSILMLHQSHEYYSGNLESAVDIYIKYHKQIEDSPYPYSSTGLKLQTSAIRTLLGQPNAALSILLSIQYDSASLLTVLGTYRHFLEYSYCSGDLQYYRLIDDIESLISESKKRQVPIEKYQSYLLYLRIKFKILLQLNKVSEAEDVLKKLYKLRDPYNVDIATAETKYLDAWLDIVKHRLRYKVDLESTLTKANDSLNIRKDIGSKLGIIDSDTQLIILNDMIPHSNYISEVTEDKILKTSYAIGLVRWLYFKNNISPDTVLERVCSLMPDIETHKDRVVYWINGYI